jgi:hypothetical protein
VEGLTDMAGPVQIKCPICLTWLPVPCEPVADGQDGTLLVEMDYTDVRAHVKECAAHHVVPPTLFQPPAKPEPKAMSKELRTVPEVAPVATVPKANLSGRIHQLLDTQAYIETAGSRACTMCGARGDACLEQARAGKGACCPVCGDGNTHPVPQQSMSCAEWSLSRAATN